MPTTPNGLRAFNVFSLILLGVGCVLVLSTALVQAEVLSSWDPATPLTTKGANFAAEEVVLDPTGGLIVKRYLIGAVFVVCGLAMHTWLRKNRKAITAAA